MKPRLLLALAWLGVVLYAYPGYMSADSVTQLVQARTGAFGLGHPPIMGVLWAACDAIATGPIGMLLLQVTAFVAGTYLLLRPTLGDRAAAAVTLAITWFPPIACVLAVIWKDSQMLAYLVLGVALLRSPRRGIRLTGLALIGLATAMRYNALSITLAPVVLLFEWRSGQRRLARYAIALCAWLVVTIVPAAVNAALVVEPAHLWSDSLALLDLTGTIAESPPLADADLRTALAGTPLRTHDAIQATARMPADVAAMPDRLSFGTGTVVPALWATTFTLFAPPNDDAERTAIARAWRTIVFGRPTAYLAYRWRVFRELIHLGDGSIPSAVYASFTDSLDRAGSAARIGHNAVSSHLQRQLHRFMGLFAESWLFRPWIYIALSLVLLPLARRDRLAIALLLAGLAGEAALFVLAPTVDFRYSVAVVATSLLALALVLGPRLRRQLPTVRPKKMSE